MIGDVQQLFLLILDIIRLRKGPESVPYSPLLASIVALLWLLTGMLVSFALDREFGDSYFRGLLISITGLLCYAGVLVATQRSRRLLQTLTAILGCGIVFSLIYVLITGIFTPLLGTEDAALLAFLVILWSIPVEGHIMARSINSEWIVGLSIAIAVFIVQVIVNIQLSPAN